MTLAGKIALVTGSSRGVGRGVAQGLGAAGAHVYVTGRVGTQGGEPRPGTVEFVAAEVDRLGGKGIPVVCDHTRDDQVEQLFARIASESGRLDIQVNNVNSGIANLAEAAERRFWIDGIELWDSMNHAGLRGHYLASILAARLMVQQQSGAIFNVSSFGALGYLLSVPYGVGKAALDRMTRDIAIELKPHGVAVIATYPGFVRTEITEALAGQMTAGYRRLYDAYAEPPSTTGRAIALLAARQDLIRLTGTVQIAGEVLQRARARDEQGCRIYSPRSTWTLARAVLPQRWGWLARLVPPWPIPMPVVRWVLMKTSDHLKRSGGYRRPS
jgi:NAD(P)-dependent dehydrogenase (short-subunit alcohol dehydrogenase family)